MSIYVESKLNIAKVATNRGWGQFGDWAEALDLNKYLAVVQLWEHSYYTGMDELKAQLKAAKGEGSPTKDVVAVIDALLSFEPEGNFILITNGVRKSED